MLNMAQIFPLNLSFFVYLWLTLEYGQATLTWPAGTYGIPKAKVGCPVSINFDWVTGWRYEDTEDDTPSNEKSPSFHLDAKVDLDINRTFCIKTKDITIKKPGEWPQGRYCIYKKGDCPKGMKEGFIRWHDEDDKNINDKGGTLPDGVYDESTLIEFCCRTDGDKLKPVPLPLISPFYLKAFNTSECQRVEGAIATEEYIGYHNEDKDNQDTQNGSYPYGAGIEYMYHKIAYCYYESCHYTYSLDNNEQIQFISPKFFGGGFPHAQKCTWRFVAPENEKVHIAFSETKLLEGDSIVISEGWEGGSTLGNIDHKSVINPNGYSSQTNVLLVEFDSKLPNPSGKPPKGFRGTSKIDSNKAPPGPRWPKGTYGLPRPRAGCPPLDEIKWKIGWRFQDTEDNYPSNTKSESFHMDATVNRNDLNRSFCITTQKEGPEWPKGQYCIYKKGSCPKGLSEGYVFFDDENHKNQNQKGGTLPDGKYDKDTTISYCCRTDGDKLEPITLSVKNPFYLLAYNTCECQQVHGAIATKEYIRYDNQDTDNRDEMNGTYPCVKGKGNMTIMYCYYQACHFTISGKPQEFMSPNYLSDGYPNSQTCSWRILIQKKKTKTEQIRIKFPEFHLKKGGDNDLVRIFDGWDESGTLLAEFNGDYPPPAEGVVSNSTVVYVVFKSDSQGRSRGFRGVFLNQTYNATFVPTRPITIPAKTTEKTKTTTASNTTKSPTARAQSGQGAPTTIIVPVVIAVLIVTAIVCVYCVRRKRMERKVKKFFENQLAEDDNKKNYTYSDLETQEYDDTEEIQEIFPSSEPQ